MHAGPGHNSKLYGQDEKLPPKALRIVNVERARCVEVAARQLATLFRTPKSRILQKRKGGEEGRALRRPLIAYARSLGSPVWECAILFDLDRKQIGQEEAAFLDMIAKRPGLDKDWDNLVTFLDHATKVNTAQFLAASMEEIADAKEDERRVKAERAAQKLAQAAATSPAPKGRKRKQSEPEAIQARLEAARKEAYRIKQERIHLAVIEKGVAPNATKEQRRDAERAEKQLRALRA